MTTPLVIIGAGTYATTIRELAEDLDYDTKFLLDDDRSKFGSTIDGLIVRGPILDMLEELPDRCAVAVAIGNNAVRLKLLAAARAAGHATPSLVSPHAVVSRTAVLGDAVYLHPGSHVWSHVRIGDGVILSPHATVAHHTVLEDGAFASSGARIGASIRVGRESFVGIGAVVSTGVREIAERSFIGAGAVVLKDTDERGVYVGNPARLLRRS